MIQLREDKFLGRAVYIAEQRQQRPNDYRASTPSTKHKSCPFCKGNESQTPAAVFESHDDSDDKGAGNWQVRVVPNKYPFVADDQASSAFGIHEVIIESPRHVARTGDLSEGELAAVLLAYQQRLRHWRDVEPRHEAEPLVCPVLFKNVGRQAGASLVHLHSQLVVLPDVPAPMAAELGQLDRHHRQTGDCEFCRRFAEELAADLAKPQRVVAQRGDFLAVCPFASAHPYETWIAPIAHRSCFEDLPDVTDLANLLLDTLRRIELVIGAGGYNLILQTAPWRHDLSGRFHWRMEIRPRLSHLAGFELATGRFVNHVPPEHSAERLRNAESA